MTLPIRRPQAAVAAAPRTVAAGIFTPTGVVDIGLSLPNGRRIRVPKSLLLKLPRLTPAGIVGSLVMDVAARELSNYFLALGAGWSYHRFCSVGLTTGWSGVFGNSGDTCFTQQSPQMSWAQVWARIQTMGPNSAGYVHQFRLSLAGTNRHNTSNVWRVKRTAGVVPHFGPRPDDKIAPPFANVIARPAPSAPVVPRPWPVWRVPSPLAVPTVQAGEPASGNKRRDVTTWNPPTIRWEIEFPPPSVPTNPPIAPPIDGVNPPIDGVNPPRTLVPARPISRSPAAVRTAVTGNTRETKWGAQTDVGQIFFAVVRAKEALSEMGDFLEVVFKSLPAQTQKLYGGKQARPEQMMEAIWVWYDQIDPVAFMYNFIQNHIEDEIIGRTWFQSTAAIRNGVFGNSMGSLGAMGDNPAFTEYAKAVSQVASDITDVIFGWASDGKHEKDFAERYKDAEKALRRIAKKYGYA